MMLLSGIPSLRKQGPAAERALGMRASVPPPPPLSLRVLWRLFRFAYSAAI